MLIRLIFVINSSSLFSCETDAEPSFKGSSPFSTMEDITVDPSRVAKLVDKLNIYEASGWDDLNARKDGYGHLAFS